MTPPVRINSARIRRPLAGGLVALAALGWGWGAQPAQGQAQTMGEAVMPERLAVFLDCSFCDANFIRQEFTWVDYVRDRAVAHVHLLVTRQTTGTGGQARTLDLIGLGPFQGMDFTTVYTTHVAATEAEVRDGFLRTLQAMLVPYLMRTPMAERVRVELGGLELTGPDPARPLDDPWDFWAFELYWDGNANFESQQESLTTRYGMSVTRVTDAWKIQFRPFFNYSQDRFERRDEVITSFSRRNGFTTYAVGSISPHWSAGAFADVFTSTFDNVQIRYRVMPALEYSLYPYRESNRRQLTVAYRAGASHIAYRDTTIYEEIRQLLPEHILTARYEVTQPWGEIDMGANASQYLSELDRYSLRFNSEVDLRVTQGLSLVVGGSVAYIHNQLNLPRGDADLEEVLLRRRQLETNYRAGLNFGLRYRFGSMYNNVVNPRLGGLGSQDQF